MTQEQREEAAMDELAERRAAGELAPVAALDDVGAQADAFPGGPGRVPPGWIDPPGVDKFNNATFMVVKDRTIERIVKKVQGFDEFKDLKGVKYGGAVWRKHTKPMNRAGQPVLASTEITPLLWRFMTEGATGDYVLVLHWQHMDDWRAESNFAHPDVLERHIFEALIRLTVSEELSLGKRTAPVQVFPEAVARYGLHEPGLQSLQQAFAMWPESEDGSPGS